MSIDIDTDGYPRVGHYSYTKEDLGDDWDAWVQRMYDELEKREMCWYMARGCARGSQNNLHLPPEFESNRVEDGPREPYHECDADEYPLCDRSNAFVEGYRYKPLDAFPPGWCDICCYCMYDFVHWWEREYE